MQSEEGVRELPLELVVAPDAPLRKGMSGEALAELMASISAHGLLQAIGVVPFGDGWSVVYGHRRWAAKRALGHRTIAARIWAPDERGLRLKMAHENLVREDLTPIEEAEYCAELVGVPGSSVGSAARLIGRSEAWVVSRLGLLDWPEELRLAVDRGELSVSAAGPLAGVEDAEYRAYLVKVACENGATARTTGAWRRAWDISREAADPRNIAALPATPTGAPYDAHLPCWACGGRVAVSEARYVWLCTPCKGLLAEARDLSPEAFVRCGTTAPGGPVAGVPVGPPATVLSEGDGDGSGFAEGA